jgi:hypothetical protein
MEYIPGSAVPARACGTCVAAGPSVSHRARGSGDAVDDPAGDPALAAVPAVAADAVAAGSPIDTRLFRISISPGSCRPRAAASAASATDAAVAGIAR